MRIALGIKMFIHVLKHIFNANLFTVADTPNGIESQSLGNTRLQYEHGRGTRATDKVSTLGVECRNRFGKYTMVMAVEQSDTVWTYQRTLIFITDVKYFLLHLCTCLSLFTKAGRDDDKGAHFFLLG